MTPQEWNELVGKLVKIGYGEDVFWVIGIVTDVARTPSTEGLTLYEVALTMRDNLVRRYFVWEHNPAGATHIEVWEG